MFNNCKWSSCLVIMLSKIGLILNQYIYYNSHIALILMEYFSKIRKEIKNE